MTALFGFLDLEVTDAEVEPWRGSILEVGILIATEDLRVVAQDGCVVKPLFGCEAMPDVVREMHEQNNLLREVELFGMRRYEAEERMVQFVTRYVAPSQILYPTGRSVGFDVNWIKYHMPRLAALFDRHVVDVSTVNLLAKAWLPEIHGDRPNATPHRALADCQVDLDTLRYYKQHFAKIPFHFPK